MRSNSFSNGPSAQGGASTYNGPDRTIPVQHGELCCCIWCLQGIK